MQTRDPLNDLPIENDRESNDIGKPWQSPGVEVLVIDQTEAGDFDFFDGTGFS